MKAPIDPKDMNTIRGVLTSFRTQICGAADTLGEPWKGQFLALKGDYDKMLSGLPPTDQVPAALEANSQLNCLHAALSSATSLSVMLGSAMASLAGKSAEASAAQLASAVGAEIEKQIVAGTLFKAEGVEEKIAERINTGDLVAKETCTQRSWPGWGILLRDRMALAHSVLGRGLRIFHSVVGTRSMNAVALAQCIQLRRH